MKKTLLTLLSIFCLALTVNSQTTWAAKSPINTTTGDAPYTIASGLIDDDTLPDIVIGTYLGNTIEWYKSNGDGTFTIQALVANTLNGIGSLKLVDLNGDTFLDILTTAYNNDRVQWFANDGLGNFGPENIISSSIGGASGVSLGDINNDTFLDIAVTAYDDGEVVWFSGDGTGNFILETNKIDTSLSAQGVVNLKDIDADGDLDALVATAAYSGDVIEIFRNNLVPGGTVTFTKDATSVTTGKVGLFNASFEDLDGDTNLDILATEVSFGGGPTGNLYWYEDDGTGGYTETAFTTSITNPSVAQLKDLDADGLNDIVLSSGKSGAGNDLVWFKNNGGGNFGAETVIDDTQSQTFVYTVMDLDNDGDMDIASCAFNDDDLNFFENLKYTKTNAIILTGVFDGPLTGGTPKGVELYVVEDIADLSVFGLGSANNGGGSDGQEFTFPADAASAGDYIYVSSEGTEFMNFFGQATDYTTGAMGINGDDAVELFENGIVIDIYGDINIIGDGEVWDYTDGWAYRVNDTGPDGSNFVPANWTYSGINQLEGGVTNGATISPFPIGQYLNTLSIDNFDATKFNIYPNPNHSGSLYITTLLEGNVDVSIFDMLGKEVIKTKLTNNTVNVSILKSGIYIVILTQDNATLSTKLIVD